MWTKHLPVIFILQIYYSIARIQINEQYSYTAVTKCVIGVIQKRYNDKSLTFVNLEAEDLGILQAIHGTHSVSIIIRRPYKKIVFPHRGYLIYALTVKAFLRRFSYLLAEVSWMPYSPFLIVVERLEAGQLRSAFAELLRVHVFDAVIIDALTAHMYTYNPFENQGCGRHFDRIIGLGKCLEDDPPDFSLTTSLRNLRNCTLRVASTHWPPYTIDAKESDVDTIGMDEYLFSLLSELEHFTVNFTYVEGMSDVVSNVSKDMVASGPLSWLQQNEFDVVTGSVLLLPDRATAFAYLYGHLAHDDNFKIIVRRSDTVTGWKLLTLVFKPLVWLLLFVTLVVIIMMILLITKTKDRTRVVFSLIDNLLMHSCRIRRINRLYMILLFWIVFACLVTNHYVSVLYSFTTKPVLYYQVNTASDLHEYNLRPCISDAVRTMPVLFALKALAVGSAGNTPQCSTLHNSLETVVTFEHYYTVIPYSLYYANRYKYYDKYGEGLLYSFRKPLSKIMYASYLYKGFPLYDKIHYLTMRVNAAGLTNKVWTDYDYHHKKKYVKGQLTRKRVVVVPWYIIVLGSLVSGLCFLGEILTKHFQRLSPVPPA